MLADKSHNAGASPATQGEPYPMVAQAFLPVRTDRNFCLTGVHMLADHANVDGLAKSPHLHIFVIPAKAGIQEILTVMISLDPGFHRGDDFLRDHQRCGELQ